ncbi:hypothetical protein [Aquimarina sp. I32.4]|uniref:hypothetical protein n=1 Tax=Aquimarina sp. I32.4 TaxID=2053903 RepID=UPI0011AFB007|nr:hypothetical protein [Aquimarina sp. I32.4]
MCDGWKKEKLPRLQIQLEDKEIETIAVVVVDQKSLHRRCRLCKKGTLITLATFDSRGPPKDYKTTMRKTLKNKQ